jgi:NAD(P)-dependent dehydrogenase (short-subunit alcohol dehydrogenase family)
MAIADVSTRTLTELVSLAGRSAVVTGGARGIGEAVCERLLEAGARVLVADLDGTAAARTAEVLLGEASAFAVDVADGDSIRALAAEARARYGRIDIWVNAAGIYPTTPVLELEDDGWDDVLDVNLRGTFLGAREAGRTMAKSGTGGVIVNIASTASFRVAGPGSSHYVASKFGVRGLTQSLAVELGPHDVRVLGVAPTVTLTPGLEHQRAELEAAGFELDGLAAHLPLGRVAVADDVARVVLFCASDLSILMTGTTLAVDAGELSG